MKKKIVAPKSLPLPREQEKALSLAEELVKEAINATGKFGGNPLRIAEELLEFRPEF
ncbi:hypothetical protein HY625_00915 [Candidatus Uhrbacteria bacterium]|nr:hypothetical protein [Candidatus Uhrbacteria bacterium]